MKNYIVIRIQIKMKITSNLYAFCLCVELKLTFLVKYLLLLYHAFIFIESIFNMIFLPINWVAINWVDPLLNFIIVQHKVMLKVKLLFIEAWIKKNKLLHHFLKLKWQVPFSISLTIDLFRFAVNELPMNWRYYSFSIC